MRATATVLILVLTAVLAAGAQAQTTYGLKGGLALTNLTGDNTDGLNSKTGFMIGGFAAIPIGESMAIQPEVFYVEKGTKFDEVLENGSEVEAKLKLNYIDIPVLFKYTMAGESARPYFLAGPSIGFKTSAKIKVQDESADFDYVKSTDFGLVFGLGVNFQKFLIEGRYGLGLSNINDFPDDPDSIKNSAWNFLVGYTF